MSQTLPHSSSEIEHGFADTAHGKIHFLTAGTGLPLVLLGPAGKSAHVFEPLIAQMAPHFRVFAPDMPGHGKSHPIPTHVTIEILADEMLEALSAAGIERALFFGLHTGNKLCAAIAARQPQRVHKVVLCGQSHSIVTEQARRNSIIAELIHDASGSECDTSTLYGANFDYDFGADLARIEVPTLVLEIVTAEEDRTVGRQAASVVALIGGPARRTELVYSGPGFCTLEGQAAEVAALLLGFA
jgi:esterase/lipase